MHVSVHIWNKYLFCSLCVETAQMLYSSQSCVSSRVLLFQVLLVIALELITLFELLRIVVCMGSLHTGPLGQALKGELSCISHFGDPRLWLGFWMQSQVVCKQNYACSTTELAALSAVAEWMTASYLYRFALGSQQQMQTACSSRRNQLSRVLRVHL